MYNSFGGKHDSVSVRSNSEVVFYFFREAGGQFRLIEVSDYKDLGKPNQVMGGEPRPILPEVRPLESYW